MGQILHGCAPTTAAGHRATGRYGISAKTVAKWRKGRHVTDGPKEVRSKVLTLEEKTVMVAFRQYTVLPLDDYLSIRCKPAFLI